MGICVLSFVDILWLHHGSSSNMAIGTSLLISKWRVHNVVMNFVHVSTNTLLIMEVLLVFVDAW